MNRGYWENRLATHYRLKMKRYSHHRIRLYLGFLIVGVGMSVIGLVSLLADLVPRMSHFEPTLLNGLGLVTFIVGEALIFAYEEIQRWCSKGTMLDECEFGIVGMDENTVKGKGIPIIDTWMSKNERQLSMAFWGKRNGQSKVVGMDGGKGDGFHGGEYCWVREKLVEVTLDSKKKVEEWRPYQAWSVQRGVLEQAAIEGMTTEQILADLEKDECFIKTGEKTALSTYLFRSVTIVKPDPVKGTRGRTEIPLQIAKLMWDDPDWRDWSPVIWAYDVKTMFGGAGSKLSSADQFRLGDLEDETIDKTIEIGRAQGAVTRVSNIASSRVEAEYDDLKKRGLIK